MRELNERSRDLQVQSPSKFPERESKNYKYAQSERELGHLPRNKHEATLCCSQI